MVGHCNIEPQKNGFADYTQTNNDVAIYEVEIIEFDEAGIVFKRRFGLFSKKIFFPNGTTPNILMEF